MRQTRWAGERPLGARGAALVAAFVARAGRGSRRGGGRPARGSVRRRRWSPAPPWAGRRSPRARTTRPTPSAAGAPRWRWCRRPGGSSTGPLVGRLTAGTGGRPTPGAASVADATSGRWGHTARTRPHLAPRHLTARHPVSHRAAEHRLHRAAALPGGGVAAVQGLSVNRARLGHHVDGVIDVGVVEDACAQLRLARPLATDLRRPWEKPAEPNKLTPARGRRGFRNLCTKIGSPAGTRNRLALAQVGCRVRRVVGRPPVMTWAESSQPARLSAAPPTTRRAPSHGGHPRSNHSPRRKYGYSCAICKRHLPSRDDQESNTAVIRF